MMEKERRGLVRDLLPNIRLIQLSGISLSNYYDDNSSGVETIRGIYSWATFTLMLFQYILLLVFTVTMSYNTDQLTASTITCLFFAHSIVKFIYFSVRGKSVCRVLDAWNQENSHPLFVESNRRHKLRAFNRMRKLLYMVIGGSLFTYVSWIMLTVLEEPYRQMPDKENVNNTVLTKVPKFLVQSWFPWDYETGSGYYIALGYQLYWLLLMIAHSNLPDSLFCCTVIYACEQLKHLKEILKPLIEMSSAYDNGVPLKPSMFRMRSGDSDVPLIEDEKLPEETYQPVYNLIQEFGPAYQRKNIQNMQNGFDTVNEKDGNYVASAIKYWVERHKHVVRFVSDIGTMYGIALLLHMLISTVTLTLLAYQATQITGFNVFGASTVGYLTYTFIQVYAFCIFGNELIEESSSVMEAAYDCRWYDGSEEAKTFVQIVCQQCQKSLSISGAKFFTVSLDLFASYIRQNVYTQDFVIEYTVINSYHSYHSTMTSVSDYVLMIFGSLMIPMSLMIHFVLGAVVTYFMVLVQLN